MSEIKFREIIKDDLQDVFLLLNQLKEKDVNSIDLESAWKNFNSNSSSNSIVGTYDDRVVAYGSIIIENKIIEGPSFQFRRTNDSIIYNSKIDENIVFTKGTPRKIKKIDIIK